ncbi:GntR family transcriptional regulator [bacterium]|nr:MAG: GntR family transcriptional regulator [bacterium]
MPRDDDRYRYHEIARELRGGIARGEFRNQGKLPSERTLTARFGVQRNTIRQALEVLEREGRIETHGRRGSFLTERDAPVRDTLLLSLPGGDSPQLGHLAVGVERGARAAGLRVARIAAWHPEGAALDLVPDPSTLPPAAAGMILWPQNPTDEAAIARLEAALPLVLVDRRVLGVVADVVHFDDVAGGRTVTEHLIAQGHRRIGFLTDDAFAETVQHRWRGYAAALEAADIPIDPTDSLFLNGIHEPYFTISMRYQLGRTDRPTAFVCANDVNAFRLMRFLQAEGVRVPDDLAVTGYGNTMPDFVRAMALTSVDQPFERLGERAVALLAERILASPAPGTEPGARAGARQDVTIPVRLVERSSSRRKTPSQPVSPA